MLQDEGVCPLDWGWYPEELAALAILLKACFTWENLDLCQRLCPGGDLKLCKDKISLAVSNAVGNFGKV